MAIGEIQINALPEASLPLRLTDIMHLKEGVEDRRATLGDVLYPHTSRTDNPHAVTKGQIGLSNVVNELQLIKSNNLSDVPDKAVARQNLEILSADEVNQAVAKHADRTDNPHNVTKIQVGLGNVLNVSQLERAQNLADVPNKATARQNLGVLSSGEVQQAIGNHVNDKRNPHGVTKTQVGLGNVQNWTETHTYTENNTGKYVAADALYKLYKAIQDQYPIGSTVISYNSANPSTYLLCGGTWVLTSKGRCLVGYDDRNAGRAVGSQFGAATVTLNVNNLPSHSHSVTLTGGGHNHTAKATASNTGDHSHATYIGSHSHSVSGNTSAFDYGSKNTNTTGNHAHGARVTMRTGTASPEGGGDWTGFGPGGGYNQGVAIDAAGNHYHTVAIGAHSHSFSGNTSAFDYGSKASNTTGDHTHAVTVTVDTNSSHTHTGNTNATGGGSAFSVEQPSEVVYIWRRTA